MFKKVSIRARITIMVVILLSVCCIGLTVILNMAANKMAYKIDAALIFPAQVVGETKKSSPSLPNESNETIMVPSTKAQKARGDFRTESIMYMILIIIAGGFFTYYLASKALNPLHTLNRQVKNINVHNLSEIINIPPSKDEIAELTRSFNEMTDKLNEAFLMQQRFAANAAHELRTPLAVLQAKVDVFKKKNVHTSEEYDALISVIDKQTARLRSLVGNLLNMSNMDEQIEKSEFNLTDILEDIILELSHIAKERKVELILKPDDSLVKGSIDLLYQAFYNLVENGIKYNVDGGKVFVEAVKIDKDKVMITVKDTGIGIPDEIKKHIFEPFYRVDKSRSSKIGGAGLGLSIVDIIIKKHKGEIILTDNEQGGSSFKVLLDK